MIFELWDQKSANLIGAFDTEVAALTEVRSSVERHGRSCAEQWALAVEDDTGDVTTIATGDGLIDRALGTIRA